MSDDDSETTKSRPDLPAPRQGGGKSGRDGFAAIEDPRLERSLQHERGEFVEDTGDDFDDDDSWDAGEEADQGGAEFAGTDEWEQGSPGIREKESSFRSTSDPSLRKRHIKRKKVKRRRKNREAVPGWDRGGQEGETGVDADQAGGKESGDGERDLGTSTGRTRHRGKGRRRRKKGSSKMEKVFVVSPKIIAILATIVVSIVIIIGTFGLHRIARLVPGISIPSPSEAGNPVPFSDVFVPDEADVRAAREVLDNYLAADSWEAKLAFVRKPQDVRPLDEGLV